MSQPLTGPAVKSKEACLALLTRHNPDAAACRYLVDLYFDIAGFWDIRPDVLIAQMIYETRYFNSKVSKYFNNYAGIGASAWKSGSKDNYVLDTFDNTWKTAIWFPNVSWGVWAHFSHFYCYINAASIYNEKTTTAAFFDRRYGLTRSVRLHKLPARTTADLTNAWGGDNYGAAVDSIYDAI